MPRADEPSLSTATRFGVGILIAACVLGIVADHLLGALPWGVNLLLVVGALVAAGVILARWQRIAVTSDAGWLAATILLLATAYLRRASPMLQAFDLIALGGVLALAATCTRGVPVRSLGLADHARALATAAVRTLTGALGLVVQDIRWQEVPRQGQGRLRQARAVALGIGLALPALLVFGGLFMSADAIFESVVTNALALDLEATAQHLFWTALCGGLAAGYLAHVLLPRPARPAGTTPALALGIVPVGTALALVALLFLLFVVVQLRYLFGGETIVQETTGLTLAEYARGGFFQLVMVSGLVLPLLLGADWTLRHETPDHRRTFQQLAAVLLGLLLVVMASALERRRLYVGEFGLTEDRLYAAAFMGYLLVLFAWFAWTVLRERRQRFAFGAFIQGLTLLAGLHVLNPDALIARTNIDRGATGARFDAPYLAAGLSADAVPVLLERLPGLAAEDRCRVAQPLLHRWAGDWYEDDWRSWNWARSRARRLVEQQEPQLRALACDPRLGRMPRSR